MRPPILSGVRGQAGGDPEMVAETALAPGVQVDAGAWLQAAHDHVVEAVAHLAVPVHPRAVARAVAAPRAEGGHEPLLAPPDDERELGGVVALAVVRADRARARARERA